MRLSLGHCVATVGAHERVCTGGPYPHHPHTDVTLMLATSHCSCVHVLSRTAQWLMLQMMQMKHAAPAAWVAAASHRVHQRCQRNVVPFERGDGTRPDCRHRPDKVLVCSHSCREHTAVLCKHRALQVCICLLEELPVAQGMTQESQVCCTPLRIMQGTAMDHGAW